jgi:hypothetical protein
LLRTQPLNDDDIHTMPVNDLREHVSRPDCWCKPTQDDEEPRLWVHHSMDRREEYETTRRLQ